MATTTEVADPRVLVVSGLPGAGKSTTAAALARRLLPAAAHVEADALQAMIVAGSAVPRLTEGLTPEAERQLRLRLTNACLLARSFVAHGFTAVVDDVIAGPRYDHLVESLAGAPFGFVMLLPDFDHVKARWKGMGSPITDEWDWIDDDIRSRTPHVGLWLDTTRLTVDEVVDQILRRFDETAVEP